ncbi:alanine dehydrogenase [Sneathiella sp.]|uniref:alanine dehydrogenase n=1 Tax=Sneathiella sp. TaxID=1964365 RepID=UPI002FE31741
MIIGCPKETKDHEYRVGLTPESAAELIKRGHGVLIEKDAGRGIGASDAAYRAVGAEIIGTAAEIFARADMIIKVKELQAEERPLLRAGQIFFAYLHLAPDPEQTHALMQSGAVCIAYETVTGPDGGLPLLKPMSQVAGRLAVQVGATALEKSHGGSGILLGGVPGVSPAKVVIIGGGVVGFNAAQMAVGMHADVFILDRDPAALERLENHFEAKAQVLYSTGALLERLVLDADVVIGAVLIPGAATPRLVTREMIRGMREGSVVVDVAIDQGGCFETSRPTTHTNPTYVVDGVVHYCVANMPGGVARTSTYALNNATLPHALRIADKGWRAAMQDDPHLANGLNVWNGKITHAAVARDLNLAYTPASVALQG